MRRHAPRSGAKSGHHGPMISTTEPVLRLAQCHDPLRYILSFAPSCCIMGASIATAGASDTSPRLVQKVWLYSASAAPLHLHHTSHLTSSKQERLQPMVGDSGPTIPDVNIPCHTAGSAKETTSRKLMPKSARLLYQLDGDTYWMDANNKWEYLNNNLYFRLRCG